MDVRPLGPEDFLPVCDVADAWFGRAMAHELHPIFFHHFGGYAVIDDGELVGFLIGLRSQRNPDIAFIHLVGIHPERRGRGIGSNLYERFERQARSWGCERIEAITTADNRDARSFHAARGFREEVVSDWAGRGDERIVLQKRLELRV